MVTTLGAVPALRTSSKVFLGQLCRQSEASGVCRTRSPWSDHDATGDDVACRYGRLCRTQSARLNFPCCPLDTVYSTRSPSRSDRKPSASMAANKTNRSPS